MVKKIFAKSYVALILCLMYAPIFVLIAFSFTESTLIGNWSGFSFKLYVKAYVFRDRLSFKLLSSHTLCFEYRGWCYISRL